jgi:hypothetical protein
MALARAAIERASAKSVSEETELPNALGGD